jgi:hypothetical protein
MSKKMTVAEHYAKRLDRRENKAAIGAELKAKRQSLIHQINLAKAEVDGGQDHTETWRQQVEFHRNRFVESMKNQAKTGSTVRLTFDTDALCYFFGEQMEEKFNPLSKAISGKTSIDKVAVLARLRADLFELETAMFDAGVMHGLRTSI